MTQKPAPQAQSLDSGDTIAPAAMLPLAGGAWIIRDGQLVRDEAEPQTMPAADPAPSNAPSKEA